MVRSDEQPVLTLSSISSFARWRFLAKSASLLAAKMQESSAPISDSTKAKSRARWRRWISLLLLAIVFFFVVRSLLANFKQIRWREVHLQSAFLFLSLLSLVCARL